MWPERNASRQVSAKARIVIGPGFFVNAVKGRG